MIRYTHRQHNWLAFYINNKSFARTSNLMSGIVVDLGCGEKPFKGEIKKLSKKYFGVEWPLTVHNKEEIDIYSNISKALPFKSDSVDTIVSFQVMEHLPEPFVFLKECRRILCKNGKIILTTPFMWGVHEAPYDYYRYTQYGLKYLLEKSGFRNINVLPNTGFWVMAGLRLNYHLNQRKIKMIRPFLGMLFRVIQKLALYLDRIDFNPSDAASFTATAEK
jgi:SAM-dependent methyltransferase